MAAMPTPPRLFPVLLLGLLACGGDEEPPAEVMDAPPAAELPASAPADRASIDEARAMLGRAVAHYEQAGREQALRDFTAPATQFVDRDLYVFCYGPDGLISAHGASADLVGDTVASLRDVDGKAFGEEMTTVANASPEGGQVEYKWANPTTGQVEPKVSVVRKVGSDVCGVGAYRAAM